MDQWDKEFIDLVEPGYVKFINNSFGSFHFGCVYANIDYRIDDQGAALRPPSGGDLSIKKAFGL